MTSLTKRLTNQSGQTATEYMLIIGVLSLGVIAGASILLPKFKAGSAAVAKEVEDVMTQSAQKSSKSTTEQVNQGQP